MPSVLSDPQRIFELIGKCFTASPDVQPSPLRSPQKELSPLQSLRNYNVATLTKTRSLTDTEDDDVSSSTSSASSRSLTLSSNGGVSYRQLAQVLAPRTPKEKTEAETVAAFYLVALQALKEERQVRARLRTESGSEIETDDGTTSETSSRPRLDSMYPTPQDDAEDEARRIRRKKLQSLRQRTTKFAITVGKPISFSDVDDMPKVNDSCYV